MVFALQNCISLTNFCVLLFSSFSGAVLYHPIQKKKKIKNKTNKNKIKLSSVLSDNSLLHIDSDAFIGLIKLKRLSLHNCGLSVVPGKALSHLENLNAL